MDFEKAKKAYDSMDWQQQKQFAEQNKNNPEFQQFANQYLNGGNPTPSQLQPSNPQPETGYTQNQDVQDGQNWGNQGQYATDKQFDPNERLDESRFTDPNARVRVQEGTAQQTGRPDYEIDSDARDAEMINNLNAYKVSNPEFFESRDAFNKAFEYHNRKSDRQRAVLDSVWKKKELEDSVKNLKTGADISNAMNSYNLTAEQLDMLKKSNEAGYREYMQIQEDKIKLNIVNRWEYRESTFVNPQDIIKKVMKRMGVDSKLKIQEMSILDAYEKKLKDSRYNEYETQVVETNKELENVYSQLKSIESEEYAASGTGASRGLIESKISKRTRGLQAKAQSLEYKLQNRKNLRDHELAMVNNYIEKMGLQAKEQQRVFQDKLQAYGLSTDILSYETPEQKRERELEYTQRKQGLELKNKKDLLNLENEMTDLSVTDPKQLRNNLTNVLKDYYKEYSSIIQRPLNMVVNDVIKQAKAEGISVEEALKKNFITPLQGKAEYKAMLNKKLWIDPTDGQQEWVANVDKDGNVSYTLKGKWPMPNNLTRGERQATYKDISNQLGNNPSWLATAMGSAIPDGTTTGQCWEFTNDYLLALGGEKVFWHSLSQKVSKINGTEPKVWSIVVMDTWAKLEDGRPAWHVGIVTKVNTDGTIEITDSNWNDDKKKLTHTLNKKEMGMVKGYYYPQGVETSKNYNESMKGYYMELLDAKLTSAELKALWLSSKEQIDALGQEALQWKQDNQRKYIKEPLETIERLFNNYSSAGSAIWGTRQGAGRLLWGADYLSDYNYIKSNMTLEHLIDLKSRGATFGALSEWELNAIGNSASRIDLLNSEAKFKQELLTMYNWFLSSAGYPEISLEDLEAKAKKSSKTTRSQASVFEDLRRKNTRWKQSNEVDLIYKS